jgi:hypothetical protein
MTALCNSCDQPFDANEWCPRCEHYASEQLPEKTLDQLFDEYPAVRAYRDALRSRLWGFDVLGEQLTETIGDPFGDAFQARAVAAAQSRRVSPSRPSGLPSLSQGAK